MEPASKRICVVADDRLIDLPDCLIHSILSFLGSQQAVRSSVLSQRWRNLWRSVPCIDIDLTLFRLGDGCRDRSCCRTKYAKSKACKKEWQPFEEFSNNLFLLNKAASLDKLRIHVPALDICDRQANEAFSRWITRGIERSPAVIDIHMDLSCSLGNWFLPNLLGSSPSRLTRLLLHGVKLEGSFGEQLRSAHPLLEELCLVSSTCCFGEIISRRLRRLTIDNCLDHTQQGLVVTSPKLTSLRASLSPTCCPNGIRVTDTCSFNEASVCVTTFWEMGVIFGERLCNIFNVTHLQLFGDVMMDGIQLMSDKLPKFQNVRTLLINRCNLKTNANFQALDRFLQNTPGLKKLTLQNCEFPVCSKRRTARDKWRRIPLESQNLMSFKCKNLEVVEIKHSKDDSVDELFELLMCLWSNLGKTNIRLTKV